MLCCNHSPTFQNPRCAPDGTSAWCSIQVKNHWLNKWYLGIKFQLKTIGDRCCHGVLLGRVLAWDHCSHVWFLTVSHKAILKWPKKLLSSFSPERGTLILVQKKFQAETYGSASAFIGVKCTQLGVICLQRLNSSSTPSSPQSPGHPQRLFRYSFCSLSNSWAPNLLCWTLPPVSAFRLYPPGADTLLV